MKTKIVICTLVLMFSAFAGSVFGGTDPWHDPSDTYFGSDAGNDNIVYHNTFVGNFAGAFNFADDNTFIGYLAGNSNTTGNSNTIVGDQAGYSNSIGYDNIFIGNEAGYYNTGGIQNTIIGRDTGRHNTNGSGNTFLGYVAGVSNTTGNYNTCLGYIAGASNTTGNNNTYVGYAAGIYNPTGMGNVFLGTFSGYNETGSNKLYIANSDTATPLIYGDFIGIPSESIPPSVTVNGNLGVTRYLGLGTQAPVRMLHLVGSNAVFRIDRSVDTAAFQMVRTDISGNPLKVFVVGTNYSPSTGLGEFIINDNGTQLSGSLHRRMTIADDGTVTFTGNLFASNFNPSSLTLKDNVRTYENALDTVNRLRGVSFDWKDSGKPAVGLIAEEVAKVVPEVVAYNNGAAAGVNYASLVGVLVEAVKEQQKEVDSLKAEVQQLKTQLQGR